MKIVGSRVTDAGSAAALVTRAARLIAAANQLAPTPKPRGFVVKCKTWQDYTAWKQAQTNPRFW
jgi:hypothetical protein